MIPQELIKKQRIIMLVLTILVVITAVISAGIGYSTLSFERLLPTFLVMAHLKKSLYYFLFVYHEYYYILAGMALALSGVILQGITRNDLADPGIIGINSGAGVAIAIFFLFSPIHPGSFVYMLPIVAFSVHFLLLFSFILLSYDRKAGLQPVRLVLVGIGFSMALSGLMIVLISSAEREKVDFISKWLAGNIWGADWPFIWLFYLG